MPEEGKTTEDVDEWEAITVLVHELTHARQTAPPKLDDNPDISLNDYVDAYVTREGEALYYEFMALQMLYPGREEFYKDMQEKEDLNWSNKNIYEKAEIIMDGYGPDKKDELVAGFTGIMREMIGDITFFSKVYLTYDEARKIQWLLTNTDIGIDYLKTTDVDPMLYGTRDQARGIVYNKAKYVYDFKAIVNIQSPKNYFGTDQGETIEAIAGGSVQGRGNGRDILWGGGGNDTLKGSQYNDLLLGGADNDHLHGKGGTNWLYGGEGKDSYYIGEGIDLIFDSDADTVIKWKDQAGEYQELKASTLCPISQGMYRDDLGLFYLHQGTSLLIYDPSFKFIGALNGFGFLNSKNGTISSVEPTMLYRAELTSQFSL